MANAASGRTSGLRKAIHLSGFWRVASPFRGGLAPPSPQGDSSARLLNKPFVKKPVQKDKMRLADNAQAHRPEAKADEVLVDPATGLPVVRDLRFREFVAHQRDLYFLNLRAGQ